MVADPRPSESSHALVHVPRPHAYDALWARLDEKTSQMVRVGNYRRLFDAARRKVRAWEAASLAEAAPDPDDVLDDSRDLTPEQLERAWAEKQRR